MEIQAPSNEPDWDERNCGARKKKLGKTGIVGSQLVF